jgi:predicted unusual protein kinase regulating ubiquinone biosynthesis (AarF/ABC1/UbiB family)
MISLYYNICKSLYLLYHNVTKSHIDKIQLDTMISSFHKSGCLFIKMIQWILSRIYTVDVDENLKQSIETFYDQCYIHSEDYTRFVFEMECGYALSTKYELLDILGSGSMGQVYKVKHKKTGKLYALKVLHPQLHNQFKAFSNLFWIVERFCDIRNYVPLLEFDKFFEGLRLQMDLRNEANFLLEFRQIHDNSLYIIPELVHVTENTMVMTYLPSDSKDSLSEYKTTSIFFKLILYNLVGCYHGICHGDLHKGNWGYQKDKLIIYDFGYCVRYDPIEFKVVEKLVLSKGKSKNLSELIQILCKHNCRDESAVTRYLDHFKNTLNDEDILLDKLLENLFEFTIREKLYLTSDSFNALITCSNIENMMDHNVVFNERSDINEYITGELIDLCDSYDIFPEFKNYLKSTYPRYMDQTILTFDFESLKSTIKDKQS